jgi:hypothetical protein
MQRAPRNSNRLSMSEMSLSSSSHEQRLGFEGNSRWNLRIVVQTVCEVRSHLNSLSSHPRDAASLHTTSLRLRLPTPSGYSPASSSAAILAGCIWDIDTGEKYRSISWKRGNVHSYELNRAAKNNSTVFQYNAMIVQQDVSATTLIISLGNHL